MTKEITDWPKRLEQCAQEARSWTAMRDEAIRQMHATGASLRDIAKVAGLSHGAIDKIVKKG